MSNKFIPRDISWLAFNERVLQEAKDPKLPLKERIRFLGIHSNNQDEFFRVRVATLKRLHEVATKGGKPNAALAQSVGQILQDIQKIVMEQHVEFGNIWKSIVTELAKHKVFIKTEKQLNPAQQQFVETYYDEMVSPSLIPLMIEDLTKMPYLRDKSIYLAVVMRKSLQPNAKKYSLIEIPAHDLGRFVQLPASAGEKHIMLLEDVVRYNLPFIFSIFDYDEFSAHLFKITKDAEIDIDSDFSTSFVQKIEKGLKRRREGRPVRFVYDRDMDSQLLHYLLTRLKLTNDDNIIPGDRIHNFRHFMNFPDVVPTKATRKEPFIHPDLDDGHHIADVILKKDVLLALPYHAFTSLIHLLREAAMDPKVHTIKINAYRLAPNSKIINALINAHRNGKNVTVFLELRARFDEEANLRWKEMLEQEGVKVLPCFPNKKVHAKLCIIKKKDGNQNIAYGFVSTGNLNEKTAKVYGDFCVLTSQKTIMADVDRVFDYLERPDANSTKLKLCKKLLVCPTGMRRQIEKLIVREIEHARRKKPASIIVKVNSLSDEPMIQMLYKAAQAGVDVKLIVRGIFCARFEDLKPKPKIKPTCISIVDEYLEHARVLVFHNNGKPDVYISSADFMTRNLDYRVEAAIPVLDKHNKEMLLDILQIQLNDNVKARKLDKKLLNEYVESVGAKKTKSQIETYKYLASKKLISPAHPRHDDKSKIKI